MCPPAGPGVPPGSCCSGRVSRGACDRSWPRGTPRHGDAGGFQGRAALCLLLARGTAGNSPWPCWCCGPGILSTPVLAEHPRDSGGVLGAASPAGSACSGQHTSFHSPAWRVPTLGQPAPSKGAWNSAGNQPGNQLSPASELSRGFGAC